MSFVAFSRNVRRWSALGISAVVTLGMIVSTDFASHAADSEHGEPLVGSLTVGGSVTAGIDERSGELSLRLPAVALAGGSLNEGSGVTLDLAYSQRAVASRDHGGEGLRGWTFGVPRVMVDGGVRVAVPSGEVYTASADAGGSGLHGYVQGDLAFRQEGGVLPARAGVRESVEYGYSLEYAGGLKEFFGTDGLLVARVDRFGSRSDWLRDNGRLIGVVDSAGSRATLSWLPDRVEILAPQRSDGVIAKTVIELSDEKVVSVTDAVGQKAVFGYNAEGLLSEIKGVSGSRTVVTYQNLRQGEFVVDELAVFDDRTGVELSRRSWSAIGDHNAHGNPAYASAASLWMSGDDHYRYTTAISDGLTRLESTYNSMGLMIEKRFITSTKDGEFVSQDQAFEYPGTAAGGAPESVNVPAQYAMPIVTRVTHRDRLGRSRTIAEHAVFDSRGHIVEQVASDGTVTQTEYDSRIADGWTLPFSLATKQTVRAHDGGISVTRNTLTPDGVAVAATVTEVTEPDGRTSVTSSQAFDVRADGFVARESVTAAPGANGLSSTATTYDRVVDENAKTVTISRMVAAGTDAESTTSTVTDIATGLVVSSTDEVGRVASRTFDAVGRVVEENSASGHRSVYEYGDRFTRVVYPSGIAKTEYVDAVGRVVALADNIAEREGVFVPDSQAERTAETRVYERNGSRVRVSDSRGRETVTDSDVVGRPVSARGPSGLSTVKQFDDVANTVESTVVGRSGRVLQTTTTQLDDRDREIGSNVTRDDAVPVPDRSVVYDGLGRVKKQSENDVATSVVYNADGTAKSTIVEPQKRDDFPGAAITADRDHNVFAASTKKTLTQEAGGSQAGVERVLDAAGRMVLTLDQTGVATRYSYTPDGLVDSVVHEGSGTVTRNVWDETSRALRATETSAPGKTTSRQVFTYDPVTENLASVCDPADCAGTALRYSYDVFGNTTEIVYPDGKSVQNTFDEVGNRVLSKDVAGNVTAYEYDAVGILVSVSQTNPSGEVLASVSYTYDEFGRATGIDRSNGVSTRYAFTSANEVAAETTTDASGKVIFHGAYTYDSHGNLATRFEERPDGTNAGVLAAETTTYRYNAFDQLIESCVYAGDTVHGVEPRQRTSYNVGVSGEVAQETVTRDGESTTRDLEYNPLGQLTGVLTRSADNPAGAPSSQQYDAAGNVTSAIDGTTYMYDVHNRLVSETSGDGTVVEHAYWTNGQRMTVSTQEMPGAGGVESTELYWDGATLVNETRSPGRAGEASEAQTESYLIGLSRHARTNASTADDTRFYVTDRHGSTRAMTDNTGVVEDTYSYSDYGIQTESIGSRSDSATESFLYGGEYTTRGNKQLLSRRVYDPTVFSFTARDDADEFNLYSYAGSNPITFVDPSGQAPDRDDVAHGLVFVAGLLALGMFVAAPKKIGITLASIGVAVGGFGLLAGVASSAIAMTHVVVKNTSLTLNRETTHALVSTEVALIGASFAALVGAGAYALMGKGSPIASGVAVLRAQKTLTQRLDDLNRQLAAWKAKGVDVGVAAKKAAKAAIAYKAVFDDFVTKFNYGTERYRLAAGTFSDDIRTGLMGEKGILEHAEFTFGAVSLAEEVAAIELRSSLTSRQAIAGGLARVAPYADAVKKADQTTRALKWAQRTQETVARVAEKHAPPSGHVGEVTAVRAGGIVGDDIGTESITSVW